MTTAGALPDPERTKRYIGLALYALGMIAGIISLLIWFVGLPLSEGVLAVQCQFFCCGGLIALPAGMFYLFFPRLLDRYDPEPWYALIGCLAWGGIAAVGFSVTTNEAMGAIGGKLFGAAGEDLFSAVISAPIFEELFKAMAVWGVFFFLRREFDGVVDGIIYACFVALGFAMIENVTYYGNYYAMSLMADDASILGQTVIIRGVLAPWGHPLYTAMTGIGLGLARELGKGPGKFIAPVLGYMAAVLLHSMWNGSSMVYGLFTDSVDDQMTMFLCALPLWMLFVLAFVIMVIVLVRRRGDIMRKFLLDEVAIGTISQLELIEIVSVFGLLRSRMRHGRAGAEFARSVARLALSKWHTTRAAKNSMQTVSMSFIGPLRQRIRELRSQLRNGVLA